MTPALPRAFAMWFAELRSWDVRSTGLRLTRTCEWPTVQLGAVGAIRYDIVPEAEIIAGSVELLDRISFDEGRVYSGKRRETKMVQYRAKPGDIVVSKINARKRAIGIVPLGMDVGITIHFRAIEPDKQRIEPMFLWLALRSRFCMNQFEEYTGGIGKGEISESRLMAVEVPAPPLETQRAILTEWQKAQQAIATAEEQARKIAAEKECRFLAELGLKLPTEEPAPKVFSVRWSEFFRWSVSFNQAALTGLDITRGKFPAVQLGTVLQLVQYGTSEKANTRGKGVPVLRINNIKNGSLDLTNLKHIVLPERIHQGLLLQDGDILIIRTSGSRDLVGTCAVFHEPDQYVYASYLIRLRTDPSKADPDFVSFFVNSALGRQQVNAISRQIMQNNINSEELRGLQLPLPPMDIQRRIAADIAARRARIARERKIARTLARQIEADVEAYLLGSKKVGTP